MKLQLEKWNENLFASIVEDALTMIHEINETNNRNPYETLEVLADNHAQHMGVIRDALYQAFQREFEEELENDDALEQKMEDTFYDE